MTIINKRIFYQYIPGGTLFPTLQTEQIYGLGVILDYWNHRPQNIYTLDETADDLPINGIKPQVDHAILSYLLATIYHETSRTMQPLREGDGPNIHLPERWREIYLSDYYPYYGRGFVPLTWRSHYHKATQFLRRLYPNDAPAIDLVKTPDQVLDSKYAFAILLHGMAIGLFTGQRLSTFINPHTIDFIAARRTISGMDNARIIAGYANTFMAAVMAGAEKRAEANTRASHTPTAIVQLGKKTDLTRRKLAYSCARRFNYFGKGFH